MLRIFTLLSYSLHLAAIKMRKLHLMHLVYCSDKFSPTLMNLGWIFHPLVPKFNHNIWILHLYHRKIWESSKRTSN